MLLTEAELAVERSAEGLGLHTDVMTRWWL